jgi:undecaprenyl-diphosphatase
MPTLVQAALLGILQGLTEFLPISSTAHLLIGSHVLGYVDPGGVFTVMIQFGSILAVMWLYRQRIARVVVGLVTPGRERHFAIAVVLAFAPAAFAGAFLADFVKRVLYESFATIAGAFIVGGIVMLVVERLRPQVVVREAEQIPVGRAVSVGVFQTLALVPGVSRSGATIVGGMLMGLDRRAAAEFSFFLAIPTMAAAFLHDLLEVRGHLSSDRAVEIAVGFVMAFLASLVVVKPFLSLVTRSGFAPFGWYRIAAGVGLLAALAAGWL